MTYNILKSKFSRKKSRNRKKGGNDDDTVIDMKKVVIKENNGYSTGVVTLNKNDSFLIESGKMLYVEQQSDNENKVNITTQARGSVMKSIRRKFLSSENIFINKFSGSDSGKETKVHFGSAVPGDIVRIVIKPDESYTLSSGTYIASSANLNVSARVNLRGILSGEGIGLTIVKNKSKQAGHLYLGCFGKAETITVKPGNEILLDNSFYLASKNKKGEKAYSLTKLKGIKSFIFGGEGILMKFKNDTNENMTVYTQTHDLYNLAMAMYDYLPNSN